MDSDLMSNLQKKHEMEAKTLLRLKKLIQLTYDILSNVSVLIRATKYQLQLFVNFLVLKQMIKPQKLYWLQLLDLHKMPNR